MGAVKTPSDRSTESIVKKALALEKLFQSLSQGERDALLHMSDREEETGEETGKETGEETGKEDTGEDSAEEDDGGEELGFRTEGGSTATVATT